MDPRVLHARLILAQARAEGRPVSAWIACAYDRANEVLDRYLIWDRTEHEAEEEVAAEAARDPSVADWTLTSLEQWLASATN
jgi:hypothetical protein